MTTGKRDWWALDSVEDDNGTFCVDVFERPDGSFGFEMFRRDPEDQGRWTILNRFATARFETIDDARATAARTVPWSAGKFGTHQTAGPIGADNPAHRRDR